MHQFKELYDFVDRAVKNRKYAENTGYGIRAALRLFEEQLNEDEKASVEKVLQNVDSIYMSVYQKNGNKYGADSLRVYKSRVVKAINDFREYGMDPVKMAAWNPPRVLQRSKRRQKMEQAIPPSAEVQGSVIADDMQRFEIPVGSEGKKAIIAIPRRISEEDAELLKSHIALSVRKDGNDKQNSSGHAD